ncbi:His/Gly/Thr/Pro-type tRNA ligase C-terminal domain-containing protein [Persicimonas caeni]|uniref:His/Gly/Thr/Pro-type tRNA ligase C-terminal domain-containing protein n=1 Tax=Persicimonas caeni TaxID=2292766 RepID=UPI001C9BA312|nr:His/Gly/Thr/Pro-type tRNA ligase C-terminal domain-containing protein [Persicimonas caeni]
MGLLLEHHKGRLPAWLAPVQAHVLPIGEDHVDYADALARELGARGIRGRVVAPDESVGRRIAEAHDTGIPWMLIVGDREVGSRSVSVRDQEGQQNQLRDEAIAELAAEASPPV